MIVSVSGRDRRLRRVQEHVARFSLLRSRLGEAAVVVVAPCCHDTVPRMMGRRLALRTSGIALSCNLLPPHLTPLLRLLRLPPLYPASDEPHPHRSSTHRELSMVSQIEELRGAAPPVVGNTGSLGEALQC